jgi:hypothetical protein
MPRTVTLSDGRIVANPGSVGLPAFSDDHIYPHDVQTGSPHARYLLAERREGRWTVEQRLVEYDWDSAARTAAANGRPDWARWLASGRTSS